MYGFEIAEQPLIERLKETQVPRKAIQGTPWYNILTNPVYIEMFCFLGPHVKNRERYIKDHDFEGHNNYLQADVVTILLNLCAIPDEVAKKLKLNYFDSYYNTDFLRHMDGYKKSFS